MPNRNLSFSRMNLLRARLLKGNKKSALEFYFALFLLCSFAATGAQTGIFEGESDIGNPSRQAPAIFDSTTGVYTISGGGENMWFTNDSFHFVWKRVSGDFALESDIAWLAPGGNAHRKACLLIRQDLTPGSAYVDVAVHGDGLTSLQYRSAGNNLTREIQANLKAPARVGLERQGDTFALELPGVNGRLEAGGAFIRVRFSGPVYVGLGVCAHDDKALEAARFSNVEFHQTQPHADAKPVLHCALETIAIASKDRRLVYHSSPALIEAPNWSPDGKYLVFNSNGHLHQLALSGGQSATIDTGFAVRCNNDHGFSPDGSLLAISDQTRGGKSLIYTVPATGGEPKLIMPTGPSYWHGWSPDGSTLAYCAERNGEFDIYTIPANGGEEKRLTTAKGLDDGPDYSPDGQWIYFNSERSGAMQIWRMKPDGSQQEQVTSDEFNNWFPHPSPDGKWLVFLSYEKNVTGHPANQPVRLRLKPINGGTVQELAELFGGQGTINVPSWSPDSRQLAFVSYELLR
jgi:TolB protein